MSNWAEALGQIQGALQKLICRLAWENFDIPSDETGKMEVWISLLKMLLLQPQLGLAEMVKWMD